MGWTRDCPVRPRPHFFKIFFPCNSSKRLEIPRGFCKHIKPQNLGYVALKGPSGNVWNVKLVKAGDGGMSFQNGWEEFVADHNLEIADFLLFQYDGDLSFGVRVFDRTSCEKEETFHAFPGHKIKVQVEKQGSQCAREGSVDGLGTAADSELDMSRRDFNIPLYRPVLSKKQKQRCPIETHVRERPRDVDGISVLYQADLDCRWHERGVGINDRSVPVLFQHKEPPSSVEHDLCNQSFLHSDHLTDAATQVQLDEQVTCRPQTEESMMKRDTNNRTESSQVLQHGRSTTCFVKCKRLAVRRCLKRRRTISSSNSTVKQY